MEPAPFLRAGWLAANPPFNRTLVRFLVLYFQTPGEVRPYLDPNQSDCSVLHYKCLDWKGVIKAVFSRNPGCGAFFWTCAQFRPYAVITGEG